MDPTVVDVRVGTPGWNRVAHVSNVAEGPSCSTTFMCSSAACAWRLLDTSTLRDGQPRPRTSLLHLRLAPAHRRPRRLRSLRMLALLAYGLSASRCWSRRPRFLRESELSVTSGRLR